MKRIPNNNNRAYPSRKLQAGTVLVMAMVILLILSLIGIAAMNTSSLEERMAGNIQESIQAFQAAESGLNKVATTSGALNLTSSTTNSFTFGATTASVTVSFKEFSPPKRGSGYSATSFDVANFDQQSKGTAGGGATAEIHRGLGQIVPKAN
jgi:hypothetical protein